MQPANRLSQINIFERQNSSLSPKNDRSTERVGNGSNFKIVTSISGLEEVKEESAIKKLLKASNFHPGEHCDERVSASMSQRKLASFRPAGSMLDFNELDFQEFYLNEISLNDHFKGGALTGGTATKNRVISGKKRIENPFGFNSNEFSVGSFNKETLQSQVLVD